MSTLRIATTETSRAAVVAAAGWIDISNVAALEAELAKQLARPGAAGLGLDLSKADYIDSATISVLIRTKSLADDAGLVFGLIAPAAQVHQVLTETHLIEIFSVFPDRDSFLMNLPERPGRS